MKKLNILLLSVVALGATVVSCSKDDSSSAPATIEGKWTYDSSIHTKAGTSDAPTQFNTSGCADKSYLDLRTGGVVEQQLVGTTSDPCAANKITGNYTYQNSVLHLTANGGSLDYTVMSITSKKLVVKSNNPNDSSEYMTVTLVK